MSHTHATQEAINNDLKTIYPTLNQIAGNIRAHQFANMDDMDVYENAIRIATNRIMTEARIEYKLAHEAKCFSAGTTDGQPVKWVEFVKTLEKVVSHLIYDTDQAYIKGKFYPLYNEGAMSLTDDQLDDLILELNLIKTQRIKNKSDDDNWYGRMKKWFATKFGAKKEEPSDVRIVTAKKETQDAAAA